jgi:hypothetical protein
LPPFAVITSWGQSIYVERGMLLELYGFLSGCWGGEGEAAMDFIVAAGGAAMEDDYPYNGVNSYCRTNQTAKASDQMHLVSYPYSYPSISLLGSSMLT